MSGPIWTFRDVLPPSRGVYSFLEKLGAKGTEAEDICFHKYGKYQDELSVART